MADAMALIGLGLITAALWALWGWPAAAIWAGLWLLGASYLEASGRAAARRGR